MLGIHPPPRPVWGRGVLPRPLGSAWGTPAGTKHMGWARLFGPCSGAVPLFRGLGSPFAPGNLRVPSPGGRGPEAPPRLRLPFSIAPWGSHRPVLRCSPPFGYHHTLDEERHFGCPTPAAVLPRGLHGAPTAHRGPEAPSASDFPATGPCQRALQRRNCQAPSQHVRFKRAINPFSSPCARFSFYRRRFLTIFRTGPT